MIDLRNPYWAEPDDGGALSTFADFTRELSPPGMNWRFPKGAIGIRVDYDFWLVAVLPWEWLDRPLPEVVALLWPSMIPHASYKPDSKAEPGLSTTLRLDRIRMHIEMSNHEKHELQALIEIAVQAKKAREERKAKDWTTGEELAQEVALDQLLDKVHGWPKS